MVDCRELIIEDLELLRKKEQQERNIFKERAYDKVINGLRDREKPIHKIEDINTIPGVGDSIRAKIKEIIDTGSLKAAEEVKTDLDFNAVDTIMGVHGIGPVKANDLIKNHGIHSISELRTAVGHTPSLLNKQQMIGLQNYEDIQERIPRSEMTLHEEHILKIVTDVTDGVFTAALVGSYRRGAPTSGDIDVLIGYPKEMTAKEAEKNYFEIIKRLQDTYKSFDILAKGEKKCMAVARLASSGELSKARRLDLLLTPSDEYPYALLYFTGSDKFNIQVRKKAAAKGFSLSEHKLHSLNQITKKEGIDRFFKSSKDETPESRSAETPHPPHMKTEKDILDFLEVSSEFVCPKNRNIH